MIKVHPEPLATQLSSHMLSVHNQICSVAVIHPCGKRWATILSEGLSRALQGVGWSWLEPAVACAGQPRPLLSPCCQHLGTCTHSLLTDQDFYKDSNFEKCQLLKSQLHPSLFEQAKQSQLPQPLLIRLLLQTLHQLRCPSLDTLQHLNVPLVVGGPKLNTVFEPVALHGVAVAQVQDPALGLVKPHTIDLGPLIQPVQVPLQSLPTLKQINTPTQLGVVCKLTEGALSPFVQIIGKDVKQNWPQYRALGNTACDRPPTRVNSIHHHSLGLAVQPVLYPVKSTPVQAMSSQFLQENAEGNHVKGFTEV
ncbi:hypothetical protein QYF61_020027 [Mycteria americana]|uniref:Uncharacterized protein n=1 Tax=Mycteria americana TaxID=33587 RepID=A0AAN7PKG9_MYCAM|nr:hypothetical protein QYF61_020027 [Mycteria americana]